MLGKRGYCGVGRRDGCRGNPVADWEGSICIIRGIDADGYERAIFESLSREEGKSNEGEKHRK